MDDKQVLRYVINGFELIPAKFGFENSYTTKNGKATKELSKIINDRIKKNFPQTRIRTSYDPTYKTINFYRTMMESIGDKAAKLLVELLEARSQSVTRKVRDEIVKLGVKDQFRAASTPNRIFSKTTTPTEFEDFLTAKGFKDIKILPAGEGDSSKFPTFEFKSKEMSDKDEKVRIVLATGVIAGAEGEEKQRASISQKLEGKVITLDLGNGKSYPNIDGFRKIQGNVKADFAFTSGGVDTIFIQHKSLSHQQMSGIKKFMNADGTSKYKEINELIAKTRKSIESNKGDKKRLEGKVEVPIESENLKKEAVYGTSAEPGVFSLNVVEVYAIGDLKLDKLAENKYKLVAKDLYVYPEIPKGENEPVLAATYRKGRKQLGIQDVRFGIYPKSYIKKS